MDLWHEHFGHVSDGVLRVMEKNNIVDGLTTVKSKRNVCDACHFGKQSAVIHHVWGRDIVYLVNVFTLMYVMLRYHHGMDPFIS